MNHVAVIDKEQLALDVLEQSSGSGWNGFINIVLKERFGKTVMSELEHEGPLRVQRPFYPEGELCHVYLLHPPGGLVGGDTLNINIQARSGAKALFTSPGSTKFYRSAGDYAHMNIKLNVEKNASLEWFPHENIFYPGAKSKLSTIIELQEGAKLLAWDISCLGMPVNKEKFLSGEVDNRFEIVRNGKPFLLERLRISDMEQLNSLSGLRGYSMQCSFFATACNESILASVREALQADKSDYPWGATLIEDLLIVRVLGERTEKIQKMLIPIWGKLRPILLNKEAITPRIWAT